MTDETQPRPPKGRGNGRVARIAPLAGLAGRTVGEAVVASLRQRRHGVDGDDAWRPFHERNAERYAEWMGRSRGVLLKAAQIMCVVLPDEVVGEDLRGIYRAAFTRLLDEVPAMPFETAREVLTAELGRDPSEVFEELEPVPVGSASIGQVHAARLPDGRRVAVKVQYPGVEQAIRSDLANTELIATFLRLVVSTLPGKGVWDTRGIAREISERIGEELDYRIEAGHQRAFAELYRGHPFIRIPELVPELCTRRVLTMEFADGLSYSEAASEADAALRDRWGEAIFRFAYGGLLQHRFGNVDANPGNFVFLRDGTITCLDFGCTRGFTDEQVRTSMGFIAPAAAGDAEAVHRWARGIYYIQHDRMPPADEVLAFWVAAFGYLLAGEPLRVTPEYVSHALRTRTARSGEYSQMAQAIFLPPAMTMAIRVDTALLGLLGGLRAAAPWRTIMEEYLTGSAPVSELGELDAAYRAGVPQ